ncbi:MAG: alpha-L-arabinofuranosidase [Armatimonadetes bacterium]|nr:alpha-L-arabinofuranosidase [Armatimonadota bacterium]
MSVLALATVIALAPTAGIAVDPNTKYQKWDGWGTSLCWWAHVVGTYPPAVREDLMQKFFGYLKLNIVRYNIAGGENPEHHHMQYRAQLPGYQDKDGNWDWNADAGQRWVLQRAKELGANRFESFSNSPPYWMTNSGCASGGHDGKNNLSAKNYDAFAKYLVTVNEHFRKYWGITFETLEPLNEPHVDWWPYGGRQEGCRVPMGEAQSGVIEAVARELAKAKSPTKIAASDESVIDTAVKSWDALTPGAKNLVWRINTHHYGGNKQKELAQRAAEYKKRLWMSEEGNNDASGMEMAGKIVHDVRDMKPSAWIYWQVIDTTGSNWGFLDMDLNNRGETYVTHKKFFVMGNFSRFVQPGATIIDVADDHTIASLKDRELVLVSVNKGAERPVSFDLSAFPRAGRDPVQVFVTDPTHDLSPMPSATVTNKTLSTTLSADSVTTFVIRV